jgi:valyl-tRNA synthetase
MPKKTKEKKVEQKGHARFAAEEFVNNTPPGQLKDFSEPMANSYNPTAVEASWDSYWNEQGYYTPDLDSDKEPYVMVLPPPNVTGSLHLGHALTCSIQDAIMRWNRMSGKNVLWVPGVDHAGIATQVVVEKKIMRENKQTRHDLGREAFLEEVWKWKEANGSRICSQLRRLGSSLDWSRERFTMDEMCSKAVVEAFNRMFADGKIYRANRLVTWSCSLRTAISSIEVEFLELKGPTKVRVPGYDSLIQMGVITSFAYKLKENPEEEIVVATTRLETMLGDVAIAVHPDDPRYTKYIGKEVIHPFIPDRKVIVVTDSILVDMKFGTGAVKITPAHDPKDFGCGQRNNLPFINIMTDDGLINENGGPFAGQKRFDARYAVLQALKDAGLYRGEAPNPMSIGTCSRSKDIVEPVLRPQWWVDCKSIAARSVQAAQDDTLRILPAQHKNTWYHWLNDIQEWCISRQLWWGHRIPAWLVSIGGVELPTIETNSWIVAHDEEEAMTLAVARFSEHKAEDITLTQDPDVLDTWFSSGLFPFSVLGWPDKTPDMKKFFPGHLLETGHDILFFWVARMVMMSLALTDELPFNTVYLHSMVRDRLGRKMSKSLGNVIDPIDVIQGIPLDTLQDKLRNGNLDPRELKKALENQLVEFPNGIEQCGADGLRFGLLSYTVQGRDINLDINLVVTKREFCNKLWNVTKYCLLQLGDDFKRPASKAVIDTIATSGSFRNRWILNRLAQATTEINSHFENFTFGDACHAVQSFWVGDLCDFFVEMTKPVLRGDDEKEKADIRATLFTCMDFGLKLLHPIMPFVTEELFHRLPGWTAEVGSIMVASFPNAAAVAGWADANLDAQMELMRKIRSASLSTRASLNLTSTKLDLYVACADEATATLVTGVLDDITLLSSSNSTIVLTDDSKKPAGVITNVIDATTEILFPVTGLPELSAEVVKREKKLVALGGAAEKLRAKIAAPGFQQSSQDVQTAMAEKLALQEAELKALDESIQIFLGMFTPEQRTQYLSAKRASLTSDLTKAQKQLAKAEANFKKKPDNKKNIATREAKLAEVAALEAQLAALALN